MKFLCPFPLRNLWTNCHSSCSNSVSFAVVDCRASPVWLHPRRARTSASCAAVIPSALLIYYDGYINPYVMRGWPSLLENNSHVSTRVPWFIWFRQCLSWTPFFSIWHSTWWQKKTSFCPKTKKIGCFRKARVSCASMQFASLSDLSAFLAGLQQFSKSNDKHFSCNMSVNQQFWQSMCPRIFVSKSWFTPDCLLPWSPKDEHLTSKSQCTSVAQCWSCDVNLFATRLRSRLWQSKSAQLFPRQYFQDCEMFAKPRHASVKRAPQYQQCIWWEVKCWHGTSRARVSASPGDVVSNARASSKHPLAVLTSMATTTYSLTSVSVDLFLPWQIQYN